jgi:DNA (cytosine-5)-methyltransferase 1
MAAYYNEIDPYAAQWLRNLIAAGHIAPGDVDERSINDVKADDLKNYTQCHFFAGIGVWSHALRLAGWPDDRPVWTGSCPCQPFSAAGKQQGTADNRHLWPVWAELIRQRKPAVVFGEQVEAAIRHGWLDLVQADLEGIGYAVAPVGIPAAGFGAPHIRQRLWFVADTEHAGSPRAGRQPQPEGAEQQSCHPDREESTTRPGPTNGHWRAADWLHCRDGKWRPVEPGTFPLAHGATSRVGRLRAYGNAIVPQVAAEVISAYMLG